MKKYLILLCGLLQIFPVKSATNIFEEIAESLVATSTSIRGDARTLKEELRADATKLKLELESKAGAVRDELKSEVVETSTKIGDPEDLSFESVDVDSLEKIDNLSGTVFELLKTILNELRIIKTIVIAP